MKQRSNLLTTATIVLLALAGFQAGLQAQCNMNVTITANPAPPFCVGTVVTLTANVTGGTAPYIYEWETGETTQSIQFPVVGNDHITVSVVDANGCVDDYEIKINPHLIVINMEWFNGPVCEGQSMELSVYYAPFPILGLQYQWSTGETGLYAHITTSGTYSVTVTDPDSGCTLTDSEYIEVVFTPAPEPEIAGPATLCTGQSGTLSVTGGPYQFYFWSNGWSSPTINVSNPGTYSVTVFDASFCPGEATIEILPGDISPPQLSGPGSICQGAGATILIDNSSDYTGFQWSNGATGPSISVNQAGTYSVTVTNGGGCTSTGSYNLANGIGQTPSISGAAQLCAGQSAQLSVNPAFPEYNWSTGDTGQSINVTQSGTYTVTVTNAAGCTATSTHVVTVSPLPTPTIAPPPPVCSGAAATLNVGGGPFSTYAWSNGQATPAITVNQAGTYSVTVTNASGCSGIASTTVVALPSPVAVITPQPYNCNGTIVLTASGGNTYQWSNGAASPVISVQNSGTYSVTVTDVAGCTGTDTETVTIPPQPSVNISGPSGFCAGSSATLSAGPGFSNYQWSSGQVSSSITVTQAGLYSVTVTDNAGCTATDNQTVVEVPLPAPDISGPTTFCAGASVTLTVGGGVFNSYQWSGGQNTPVITVNQPGVYTVTVTNTGGCTGTASSGVAQLPAVNALINALPYTCNGIITLDASGGGAVFFQWSNGATSSAISVQSSGTYSVTVSNASGCTDVDIQPVIVPDPPQVSVSGPAAACAGVTVVLSATPGFAAYSWSGGQTTSSINVSQPGTFLVTVTDAYGCTDVTNHSFSVFPAPNVNIVGPASVCTGNSATLSVAGGFTQVNWSTGATTQNITVAQAGNYGVTVTDANGCTAVDNHLLTINSFLQPVIDNIPNCSGAALLDAGPGYTNYAWSTGAATQIITAGVDGDYSVTVSDASGCTGVASTTVSIPPPPTVAISGPVSTCPGQNATLSATAGFAAYAWSNGQTTSGISVSQPGIYSVTATDANGCSAVASQDLANFQAPVANISGPASICTGNSATLSVAGGFTQVNWSTGATTQNITVAQAGNYGVTVTDANGCTATDEHPLVVNISLAPVITADAPACAATVGLDAGAGYTNYAWSTGAATQIITAGVDGDYSVTVSDASGCTGVASTTVSIPPPPTVAISGPASTCPGQNATLGATAGFAAYAWSNGQTTSGISVSQPGIYSVTATDANGCSAVASQDLANFQAPVANISGPASICTGNSATLSVAGGFTQVNWSTGATTQNITVAQAGNYGVTVTDANGCTAVDNHLLTINSFLQPVIDNMFNCSGAALLDAGPGYTNYAWSTGAATQIITAGVNGDYSVTVSDASGCTGVASTTVSIPPPPTVAISGPASTCPGQNATLGATAGFAAYAWSNGQTTSDISVSQPGIYSVTATDANGCSAVASQDFVNFPAPVASISGPASICTGNSATLSVAGGFTQVNWSTGATTQNITVVQAGNYGVTVTDANGCTATDGHPLVVNSSLAPVITADAPACAATVGLDAGAGYTNYAWSTGAATQIITAGVDGDYTVTVSDASGCTGVASTTVSIPPPPTVAVSGPVSTCPGQNATLGATAGFAAYAWSNGQTTSGISVSQPGIYSVTATDANGCSAVASQDFANFPAPVASISGPASVCTGNSATLSVAGGFTQVNWSTGATTQNITVVQAGNYGVTVTDANGCTASSALLLSAQQPDLTYVEKLSCFVQDTGTAQVMFSNQWGCDSLVMTHTALAPAPGALAEASSDYNGVAVSCNSAVDGAAVVSATGGTAPYSYNWSTNATSQSIQQLPAGNFVVTVTDANGCSAVAQVTLAAPPPLAVGMTEVAVECFTPGQIRVEVIQGGTAPYTVTALGQQFAGDGIDPVVIGQVEPGSYTVVISDANGCAASETVVLAPPSGVLQTYSESYDVNRGDIVQLQAPAGYPALSIVWSPADGLSCADCPAPWFVADEDAVYNVELNGYGACRVTGEYSITLRSESVKTPYYVPNVIRPGSYENGVFTVFSGADLVNIKLLRVYTRWGELVSEIRDFPPNGPTGWEGDFQGKPVNPGVFVYYAELEFADGGTEQVKGDVTVLR